MRKLILSIFTVALLATVNTKLLAQADNVIIDNKRDQKDLSLFSNDLLTELKKGTKKSNVQKIKNTTLKSVAQGLLDGNYSTEFRIQEYEPYESPQNLATRLKISAYSQYENPTGIYFKTSEDIVVLVDDTHGEEVGLLVRDFGPDGKGRGKTYPLKKGINNIKVEEAGLSYIAYYTNNYKTAPKIKIHIPSGQVNGYFSKARHNNDDWAKLLNNAVCEIIDICGDNVNLAYAVSAMKEHCPVQGFELISIYDRIIGLQFDLMGLYKYDRKPKNHMFGRVIWQGYMHADGWGAAFHNATMKDVGNPARLIANSWGVAHEFGHVNQTRPGMKWVSTTEVTNNIFSAWTQFLFAPNDLRLEHEKLDGGDGSMEGGRFNAYLNNGVLKGENWLSQKGPDKMKNYEDGGDHFVKLCALWQLQLYYAAAGKGNKDLFADVTEIVRNTNEKELTNGRMQLNFMKNACDVQQEDLTDFFVKSGMLKPIDRDMDDYTRGQLTITENDCKELIAYAKKYKKPASPVIYYISGNSVNAFRNEIPVLGEYNKGVSETSATIHTISHDVWKNVVMFETYKGEEPVSLAMVGSGTKDNSSTLVQFPEGATSIKAVSWDGKRTLVYGK